MYDGQGVEISGMGADNKNHSMHLSPGLFYRIVYEYILPSYVAYSCHYYLKMEEALNNEGDVQTDSGDEKASSEE